MLPISLRRRRWACKHKARVPAVLPDNIESYYRKSRRRDSRQLLPNLLRSLFAFFFNIFLIFAFFVRSFGLSLIMRRISAEVCRCCITCSLSIFFCLTVSYLTSASVNTPTGLPMASLSLEVLLVVDHEENNRSSFSEAQIAEICRSGRFTMLSSTRRKS